MSEKKHLLIVGYGSIGRHYGSYIKENFPKYNIIVVDPSEKVINEFSKINSFIYKTLDEVITLGLNIEYAIVSNWGPDHISSTEKLINYGVRKITIEKPFCTNINDGISMLKEIKIKKIRCNIHYRWPYLELLKTIKTLTNKYELGMPTSFFVYGGSGCLSTGGIHWMDFSRRLFQEEPIDVIAKLFSSQINPRSPDLLYIDGTCIYTFGGGKRLSFCLDNNSSVNLEARILFNHGYITIDTKSIVRVYKRSSEEIKVASKQITRYGIPELIEENYDLKGKSSIPAVINEMIGENTISQVTCTAESGLIGSAMLVAALESSKKGESVDLQEISAVESSQEWLFS